MTTGTSSGFRSRGFFLDWFLLGPVEIWYALGGPKMSKNHSFYTLRFNAWRRHNNRFEIKKWYLIPMQKSKALWMVLSIIAQFWILVEKLRVKVKNERFSLGFTLGGNFCIIFYSFSQLYPITRVGSEGVTGLQTRGGPPRLADNREISFGCGQKKSHIVLPY